MDVATIPADLFFENTFRVEVQHCISRLDSSLPTVLATFVIVEWMEIAAAVSIMPYICHDNITVGTKIFIEHTSIAIPGSTVYVNVRLAGRENNSVAFDISAAVRGRVISKATHHRTIIPYAIILRQNMMRQRMLLAGNGQVVIQGGVGGVAAQPPAGPEAPARRTE